MKGRDSIPHSRATPVQVNLVPVIAKADTITKAELDNLPLPELKSMMFKEIEEFHALHPTA